MAGKRSAPRPAELHRFPYTGPSGPWGTDGRAGGEGGDLRAIEPITDLTRLTQRHPLGASPIAEFGGRGGVMGRMARAFPLGLKKGLPGGRGPRGSSPWSHRRRWLAQRFQRREQAREMVDQPVRAALAFVRGRIGEEKRPKLTRRREMTRARAVIVFWYRYRSHSKKSPHEKRRAAYTGGGGDSPRNSGAGIGLATGAACPRRGREREPQNGFPRPKGGLSVRSGPSRLCWCRPPAAPGGRQSRRARGFDCGERAAASAMWGGP